MVGALSLLNGIRDMLAITHQTGEADYEAVRDGYAESKLAERRYPAVHISDMVDEFGNADLIICRAGATTCAEVAAAGKAALMIPFPGAADDHQRKNAEALAAKAERRG